jgi:drug/metabolite transporter (DMT)-like permease
MTARRPSSLAPGVVPALLVVYLVWGSTYLAIRLAIETLPGFTMAGARFLLAGALLLGWGLWRGGSLGSRRHLVPAFGLGALLLLGGNGGVVWAEHRISSGAAALLVAVEPVWVALLAPAMTGARRAGWSTFAGLGLGIAGVATLVFDPGGLDRSRVDLWGALAVIVASLSWALGSLWTVRADLPESRAVATGEQMLAGGLLLGLAGGASGEWSRLSPASFSLASLAAFAYLVIFGSIVAFSAYGFLLRAAPPSVAATYAFVNPVVAVLLGWAVVDEPLGWRVAGASVLILGSLTLIFRAQGGGARARPSVAVEEICETPPS